MRNYGIMPLLDAALFFGALQKARAIEAGPLNVHGFVGQSYLRSTDNNDLANTVGGTTEFNDVSINVSKDLSDKIRV